MARPVVGIVVSEGEERPPGLETLDGLADAHLVPDGAAMKEIATDVEALYVWDFQTSLVRDMWDAFEALRWIQTASAGVDHVLFEELVTSDVMLTNAKGVFDEPIAEWVLAVLLVFTKDLLGTVDRQRRHRWRHRDTERLAGRRLVVVGAGGIGCATARLAQRAGMSATVVGRSRRVDDEFGEILGSEDLDAQLAYADDIVIALPLTVETRHLFDASRLAKLKRGARLVNVGRGPVVDTGALVDALGRGHVGGAALDVFEEEPLPPSHPLWDMDNVIVSPHQSGDVTGWREAVGQLFIDNLRLYLANEPLHNVVDKERAFEGVR